MALKQCTWHEASPAKQLSDSPSPPLKDKIYFTPQKSCIKRHCVVQIQCILTEPKTKQKNKSSLLHIIIYVTVR